MLYRDDVEKVIYRMESLPDETQRKILRMIDNIITSEVKIQIKRDKKVIKKLWKRK